MKFELDIDDLLIIGVVLMCLIVIGLFWIEGRAVGQRCESGYYGLEYEDGRIESRPVRICEVD